MLRTTTNAFRTALLLGLGLPACGASSELDEQPGISTTSAPGAGAGASKETGKNGGGVTNHPDGGAATHENMSGGGGDVDGPPSTPSGAPSTTPGLALGEHCEALSDKYAECGRELGDAEESCEANSESRRCFVECLVKQPCEDIFVHRGDGSPPLASERCLKGCLVPLTESTVCASDMPYEGNSGLFDCAGGQAYPKRRVHRPEVVICEAGDAEAPLLVAAQVGECKAHVDCIQKPFGICQHPAGGEPPGHSCVYGCLADSDCGADEICACGEPYGKCQPADCKSDADCGQGMLCTLTHLSEPICSSDQRYLCETPEDECRTDADCQAFFGHSTQYYCSAASGTRTCVPRSGAVCGRPFLVHGEPRQARSILDGGWAAPVQSPQPTSSALAERLAEEWTRLGLMEHASIAAFARFSLQLLQLGAPSSLVEQSNQAAQDETRHAKTCFALASQYAKQPVGPGLLSLEGALEGNSLRDVALGTLLEGCVGETIAAMEAAEGARHCGDPAVSEVLTVIQADELRHSQLAWRFLQWALERGDGALRREVSAAFEALRLEVAEGAPQEDLTGEESSLLQRGIVPRSRGATIRYHALRDVVLPCAMTLLGSLGAVPASERERLEPGSGANPERHSAVS